MLVLTFIVLTFLFTKRSPYFKQMAKKVGEYGPTYVPTSSETLSTSLLDREKEVVEAPCASTRASWKKNGVSLIVDGWSDTRRCSIHGVVAYSRGEMYFIDSHDASDTRKSAQVLASEWASTIEKVGVENVLTVVTDEENTNRAAGTIIQALHPNTTVTFCMTHCLTNLLKDIGALEWIAPIIEHGNTLVSFVNDHQKVTMFKVAT